MHKSKVKEHSCSSRTTHPHLCNIGEEIQSSGKRRQTRLASILLLTHLERACSISLSVASINMRSFPSGRTSIWTSSKVGISQVAPQFETRTNQASLFRLSMHTVSSRKGAQLLSWEWDVDTAMVLPPAATPAWMPNGESSTTTQFSGSNPRDLAARMKGSG